MGLALLSAVTLIIGVMCLWRSGETPVLVFVFFYQWLQASMAILQATLANQKINAFYPEGGDSAEATILTLVAIVALAIGMRLAAGPVRREFQSQARLQSTARPTRTWFILYVVAWILGTAGIFITRLAPAITQILNGLDALHWASFFMLAVAHFNHGRSAGWWFPAAFAFELVGSLGGYFSDFQTVFIVTFLALMMAGGNFSPTRVVGAGFVAMAALGLAVVWTAIKSDYRSYVSGGEQAQVVRVDYPERIQKLGELVGELDQKRLDQAVQDLLTRVSYVDFFGSTLVYVPTHTPHTGGSLLLDAFLRPFMPRVFFPDKLEIDDSERTRLYSGRSVAGAEEGTSISLGWVAEIYIDFGRWGMMIAAAGIGVFYGLIYRLFTHWTRSVGLLGFAVSSAVLISAAPLESSITKVIGGLVSAVIVAWAIIRFIVPRWCPWVVNPAARGA
ncbi:MAG: hypothetical protein QM773_01150 [Hyphomonadaceae bacterium]